MDREQFISIIKEHQPLIYKICYTYCREPEDRKDLQQEVMLQLWHSFKHFDGRVKITTWMYKVALNTSISFYRSERKHQDKRLPINEEIISLPDEDDLPEKENIRMLYQLINQMNDLDKALILLYLDDNKYKDIADILGITETNVATKISRLKQHLKEQFNNL